MLYSLLEFVNSYLFGPGLCAAVFICGIYLLIKLRPFFLTKPHKMIDALRSGGTGEASPVRAMIVALAGTLGVGNIAGVASAIAIGGAGAIFWMWISALAALPIKYAEIVLAVKHRRRDPLGRYHGGAYFYIADHSGKYAKLFAALFAILCIAASFAMGCAVQANAIAVSLKNTFAVDPIVCGIILGAATLAVVSGGLSRISSLTIKLIPLMSGIYIAMAAYIIFTNTSLIGDITREIVSSAISADAVRGGIIGFLTSRALRIGVTRGIVSNEAGCGTAPIAHAGADVRSPAAQGVWGMFEVFIDTIVICSLTAYVVLIAEHHGIALVSDGMTAASHALGAFLPFADRLLCAAVLIFAFCTIVCWFYYGTESLAYLTSNRLARRVYIFLYSLCAVLGCITSDGIVWSLSDLTISAMTAVNIVAVMLGIREIKHETDNYFYKDACNFVNNDIPNLHSDIANRRDLC